MGSSRQGPSGDHRADGQCPRAASSLLPRSPADKPPAPRRATRERPTPSSSDSPTQSVRRQCLRHPESAPTRSDRTPRRPSGSRCRCYRSWLASRPRPVAASAAKHNSVVTNPPGFAQGGVRTTRNPMNGRRAPGSAPPRIAARTFCSDSL